MIVDMPHNTYRTTKEALKNAKQIMKKPELDTSLYKNFKGEGAPDDFHHVAWKTMQYDEMIDFYSRLFHCKPLYSSKDITFLTFDEEHHRIAIANTSAALANNMSFLQRSIVNFQVQ